MANNMHKNDNDEGTCTSSRSTYTKNIIMLFLLQQYNKRKDDGTKLSCSSGAWWWNGVTTGW